MCEVELSFLGFSLWLWSSVTEKYDSKSVKCHFMPYIRVNSLKTELNQHSFYFDLRAFNY